MFKSITRKRLIIFILTLIIIAAIPSLFLYGKYYKNQYNPKVLVIFKKGTQNYLDAFQNYNQSYILNTQVTALDDNEIINKSLSEYDLVYPDTSLISSENSEVIKTLLKDYVSKGGKLFLENKWHDVLPEDFTGVASYSPYNGKNYSFSYPETSYNLKQLQTGVKSFFDNFTEYRKDDFSYLKFNSAILKGAKSLADVDGSSVLSINKYNNGYVLMASDLIPNNSLTTGFDLKSKDDTQKYFDYSLATLNYYVRNEFLAFSLKEKDGYVLKKILGPYGRPAMAWQNHYEALTPIKNKEGIKWIDLLKEYDEIPSYSLVRSTYDWGQWKTDVTVHLNVGTSTSPSFIGEYEDSYYSSGKRIVGKNDYITFGDYPDYKSLGDPIDKPHRAYPTAVDFDGNGIKDLIVGSADGNLYLLRNVGNSKSPTFTDKEELLLSNGKPLSVGSFASTFASDINKDGLFDLVVGSGNGLVHVYINKGDSHTPKFTDETVLKDSSGNVIKADGPVAPAFGNIDNDRTEDLVLGTSKGTLIIYKGSQKGFTFNKRLSDQNIDKFSAPTVFDWNHDGYNDILVGDNSGLIKVFLNHNTNFTYRGPVEGQTTNPNGNKALFGGHNSVPLITDWNGDNIPDLIVGQLEFGLPYDIDGQFFKYKNELKETIKYAEDHGVPIYPHFLTHKYKSPEQEKKELELHKKAFDFYGIPWVNTGVDQHTWRTNNNDPQSTLGSELSSNIWWNFGFNPPNQPDLPRDGKEFMWSTPFMLSNAENVQRLMAFAPAPNLFKYPKAYRSFIQLDMPATYFEHIEYGFKDKKKNDSLKEMAAFLDNVRDVGEYNFMTQEQMAKSFITAFTSRARVNIRKGEVTIHPDFSLVPDLAGEYKNTLGIKLERGEDSKGSTISTTSPIHYEKNGDLYFGVGNNISIMFNKPYSDDFHIVRSNVPIDISSSHGATKIKFLSTGMQQIKLYSKNELKLEGERIKTERDGNYYTITHYGYPITIKALK